MEVSVLIIDDDKHLNTVNGKVLRTAGIVSELRIVSNGKEALDYLKSQRTKQSSLPDIIVFELQTPVVDGFDFMDQFAALEFAAKEKIELVVYTSSIRPSDKRKAIAKGIRHYLSKPYLLNSLRDIISQLRIERQSGLRQGVHQQMFM